MVVAPCLFNDRTSFDPRKFELSTEIRGSPGGFENPACGLLR